ncbi:MAG TPA: hypothetical protein VH986_11715 [Acidimicrobiia bacterium]
MRVGIGLVCVLVGAIWVGQGVGWIHGSFMTGEAVWAVIGAVLLVVGGFLILRRGQRVP